MIIEEFSKHPFWNFHRYFKSKKGKISLIYMDGSLYEDCPYEIYSIDGDLFDDCERFDSIIKAIERIKQLLGE